MEGKKRLFNQPFNIVEFLGQFSETKEHLLRAGGEIFQAFRSALTTIVELSQGWKEGEDSSESDKEEIKQVDIK